MHYLFISNENLKKNSTTNKNILLLLFVVVCGVDRLHNNEESSAIYKRNESNKPRNV